MNETPAVRTKNHGFASWSKERRHEVASAGGKAAHAKGTAHEFNSDEASVAGRKGGQAASADRDHMATIGRKGGEARRKPGAECLTESAPRSPGGADDLAPNRQRPALPTSSGSRGAST